MKAVVTNIELEQKALKRDVTRRRKPRRKFQLTIDECFKTTFDGVDEFRIPKSSVHASKDMSTFELKQKYRNERNREDQWQAWQDSLKITKFAFESEECSIPLVKVERHPIIDMHSCMKSTENDRALFKTKKRLLIRRFVLDLREVWLANLQHISELRELNALVMEAGGGGGSSGNNNRNLDPLEMSQYTAALEERYLNSGGMSAGSTESRPGLEGRRDVKALLSLDHQIQSVNLNKALEKSFHTTFIPEPTVILDYHPTSTARRRPPPPIPPTLQPLMQGFVLSAANTLRAQSRKLYREKSLVTNQTTMSPPLPDRNSACDEDCMLFIDRLYPSVDSVATTAEVFWRITVIKRANSDAVTAIARESDIADYVAGEMLRKQDEAEEIEEDCEQKKEDSVGVLVFEKSNVCIAGKGSENYVVDLSVYAIQTRVDRDSLRLADSTCVAQCVLEFEIHADMQSGSELVVVSNPMELNCLLGSPGVHLSDLDWWVSESRRDDDDNMWSVLVSFLRIVELSETAKEQNSGEGYGDEVDENSDRFCLELVHPSSPVSWLDRAMTSNQAFATANYLLNLLQIRVGDRGDLVLKLLNADPDLLDIVGRRPTSRTNKCRLASSVLEKSWEELVDDLPCLSLQVSEGRDLMHEVPGSEEIGPYGIWIKPPPRCQKKDFTRIAHTLKRDPYISSTNSVLNFMTLALDTPMLIAPMICMEEFAVSPSRTLDERVEFSVVPGIVCLPRSIFTHPCPSLLFQRQSATTMIFCTSVTYGVDHIPLDSPHFGAGMRRQVTVLDVNGFRQFIMANLLCTNPVTPTSIYGITATEVTLNGTGVNPKSIIHNELPVFGSINRDRYCVDYHYIISTTATSGLNDRCAYTIRLDGKEFIGLRPIQQKEFDRLYEEIRERKYVLQRQIALDKKVESTEISIGMNARMYHRQVHRDMQRLLEKKLRKGTKSENGWAQRYIMSTPLEIQGFWEKRRCDRTGLVFFHRITTHIKPAAQHHHSHEPLNETHIVHADKTSWLSQERFVETCQWEIPGTWVGDLLKQPLPPGFESDEDSLKSNASAGKPLLPPPAANVFAGVGLPKPQGSGAFDLPDENWYDEDDSLNRLSVNSNVQFATENMQAMTKGNRGGGGGGGRGEGGKEGKRRGSLSSSLGADRSLGQSAAPTIDTANLEHLAEQLVSSDELMKVLARRLGIPDDQIVPANELDSVFSIDEASQNHDDPEAILRAPRNSWIDDNDEPEINSDDDIWSDDEIEAGDMDEGLAVDLPETQGGMAGLKRRKWRESTVDDIAVSAHPRNMPFLNLVDNGVSSKETDTNLKVLAWRQLPRPTFNPQQFYDKLGVKRTSGPEVYAVNTLNEPIMLLPLSPCDACQYKPQDFQAEYREIFIPDYRRDMERALATLDRNMKREEKLQQNIATDELLLFGEVKELTNADVVVAEQYKMDLDGVTAARENAVTQAINAAKSNNISAMEDALEENIDVNVTDQFGNSLLLLAAQQGSKRMCKFLLRRGASINFQNTTGNTALHYCFAYSNDALGRYLITKGANDVITNSDGMTCYEGLNTDYLIAGEGELTTTVPESVQDMLKWKKRDG